jgi:hypothetical protein
VPTFKSNATAQFPSPVNRSTLTRLPSLHESDGLGGNELQTTATHGESDHVTLVLLPPLIVGTTRPSKDGNVLRVTLCTGTAH